MAKSDATRNKISGVRRVGLAFVAVSLAIVGGFLACGEQPAPAGGEGAAAEGATGREYYEIRRYRVADEDGRKTVLAYLENALSPALNRAGIDRVGVFTVEPSSDETPEDGAEGMSVWTIIAFPDIDDFAAMKSTLEADAVYLEAASPMYATSRDEPIYERVESWLLRAFVGMPVMELPPQTTTGEDRIFELRLYESHNEDAARRKVHMFDNGEIDIMRDVEMAPVLFAELLVGADVPALVYILSAPDMESHREHWRAFGGHPEWERMREMEMYKGTVSRIENVFLRPTAFSQI